MSTFFLKYQLSHIIFLLLAQIDDVECFDESAVNLILAKGYEFETLSFAIGSEDFSVMTAPGRDFVDKSLFVKEVIETTVLVSIITRPRRWGKSINFDMLSKFFALKVDFSGNAVSTNPYRVLFQQLRIGQEYSRLVAEHQGQYPVIFLTLKDVKLESYRAVRARILTKFKELYDEHLYLYDDTKLTENQKEKFKLFLRGCNVGDEDIGDGLSYLSFLLEKRYNKKAYIFIDEYDAPLIGTYHTDDYDDTIKLMRRVLGGALKGNASLEKAVVIGITKIAKAGLFSDLNNVVEYSILDDDKYGEYFGFTEDEVQSLLQRAKMTDPRISNGIKAFYNGYTVGTYTLYNPWSIANFFHSKIIRSYWVNTEGSIAGDQKLSSGLLMTTDMQNTVRKLIKNCSNNNKERIEVIISPEIILHQLKTHAQAIWTLFAYGGYLALSNVRKIEGGQLLCEARIPNREIAEIYERLWISEVLKIDIPNPEKFYVNIEDLEEFQTVVGTLLLERSNIIGKANESLFHSLIEGLYMIEGTCTHEISSEDKAGSGRSDTMFDPIKGKSCKIIIQEYKLLAGTDRTLIDGKIQDALWQVYEHYYFKEAITKYREFKFSYYKQIEIRGIVAFVNNKTLGLRSASILHDFSEIRDHILPLFESMSKNELVKLKTHYRVEEFINEFRKVGSLQGILENLICSNIGLDDPVIFELGKAISNSALAKRLWSEYGKKLWSMSREELIKLIGVENQRASNIEQLGLLYNNN